MNDDQVEALVSAAAEGVEFDGLRANRKEDGYALATPAVEHTGLSAGAFREAAAAVPDFVTNWHFWTRALDAGTEARYAFLRWLERADERGVEERYAGLGAGIDRSWGQLVITVELAGDGDRRYAVRHGDDRGEDPAVLARYDDPRAARELRTFDDCGRYRPLSTAPTLRSGWVLPSLDAGDLLRAVHSLYPATVENWHAEREGALDVTHWRETAARQTGIYETVTELPAEALPWAVEACCADGACVKRRAWDADAGTPIDVDRGAGEFPCREACSLFVAAAGAFTDLERERDPDGSSRRSNPEPAQLRAIVDAVADGRVDEVPAADFEDPANRYRVRYLRAKYRDVLDPSLSTGDEGEGDDGADGS